MSDFKKGLFDQIQKKANVQPDEIMKVAQSVQQADFSDEKTVRQLIRHLSKLAGKPVSREKEDKMVKAITSKNMPKDMSMLNKLFDK